MSRTLPYVFLLFGVLCALASAAQTTVTGTVYDAENEPLIGATVMVPGDIATGTITDIDGEYEIAVPEGTDSLRYSYVGVETKFVAIDGRATINVTMDDNDNQLDEVVVVGYGTVRKRDLAGSVDQITSKTIENMPVTSLDQTLAGQVQGVQFRQGDGSPGGGAEILVRGVGSFTGDGNAPLIVIDGVPYGNYNAQTNNFLSLVNPNDIASISVVRDAAEKAIYGSRASAGLILITTKRGRATKPTVSFNTYVGVQSVPGWEDPNVTDATELATFLGEREAQLDLANGRPVELPAELQNPEQYGAGTDWFDAITRTAPWYNADLRVSGGSDRVRYFASGGYTNQDGILLNSSFERYSADLKLDVDVTDWLTVSTKLAPSWTSTRSGATTSATDGFSAYDVTTVARWADPTAPLRDSLGNLTRSTRGQLIDFYSTNPVFRLENDYDDRVNRQILSYIKGDVTLPLGITLSTSLAGNLRFNNINEYRSGDVLRDGSLTPPIINDPGVARIARGSSEEQRLIWESQLGYATTINDEHNFDAFVGYSTELTRDIFFRTETNNPIDQSLQLINSNNVFTFNPLDPEAGTQIFFTGNESIIERALISYLGRVRYSFLDRYQATVAVRSDGSSRFGSDRRYATFPSASFGWRASAEPWFPVGGLVSNLRLETSFGLSGSNTVADYRYLGPVGNAGRYSFGADGTNQGVIDQGLAVSEIPNADLGWEETEQLDVGVQLGMFDDRLNFKGTYYQQTTTGLLFGSPIPQVSGYDELFGNIGELRNRGVELGLNARPVSTDRLIWTVDLNLSVNRNKIIRLGPGEDPTIRTTPGGGLNVSWTVPGNPVAQYYGLQQIGLFTPEDFENGLDGTPVEGVFVYPGARVGSPKFFDGNGDSVLNFNTIEDFVQVGNPWPDFTYGFNTSLSFDDFTLTVTGLGEVGSEIFDLQREILFNTNDGFNLDRDVLGFYRIGDTDYGVRPPVLVNASGGFEPTYSQIYRTRSSANVVDGTYFKINTIRLSYNLDLLANDLAWLQQGAVYVAVQNAFLISGFQGNPQISRTRSNGVGERNVRYGAYPTARVFTVGATITL